MTPNEFIKQYKPFALETERKTGISHLFTLAQAALGITTGSKVFIPLATKRVL